ncbi:hypothetical protein [Deinococcus alpinitundrae]|uniref:hypothetical protein n=1 Tax=Deinococcus alpinitundrae TaxID=468913 RepID=UPI0013795D38|nr:hypothetical protein [Deinococcus alpinitundrae]
MTRPITFDEAVEIGCYPAREDMFLLLQGDIIHTEAAFSLGERITGGAKFVVVSSTCDTVRGRKRSKALLYEVHPIYKPTNKEEVDLTKSRLNTLLRFKEVQYMYLPPLPGDPENVIANVISFDDPAIARIDDIVLAHRIASLSLPGWRILASLLRSNLTREGSFEAQMRFAFASQSNLTSPNMKA